MKKIYLLAISVALVALLALAACAPNWGQPQQGGMMGPQGTPGMLGPSQQPYPYGPGGMMGPGMMGPSGMMGGWGGYNPNAERITIDAAAEAAERYLSAYWQDLALAEVMEFAWNFYAEVEEEATGIHAMELLIDKYTGQVYPEMGPNMMWNTKYGMHGNYYGAGSPTADIPVTKEQAKELAQQFLDDNLPGVTVGEADVFYGYYTLHTLKDGKVEGMLSVNDYNGAVWYHNWHGLFIQMKDFEH
jgi:hypothetical protein